MVGESSSFEEIWRDDLLGRKDEARQIIGYIESVVERPYRREDKRSYTITIDAQYGEGKTFFLKRFARTVAANHPVAFVDAWADDLADEPLTALVATLKTALEPFTADADIQPRFQAIMEKAGKVAKIASLGLARRSLGVLITGAAVAAIGEIIGGATEAAAGALNDAAADAVKETIDDASEAANESSRFSMQQKVEIFEQGKCAIQELKSSLDGLIEAIEHSDNIRPPIFIFIDELDRCRPTYAIKLLEEIKHLFDVPGLIFILSIHSDQLARSIVGAYGPEFDGKAYLSRFIDRSYRLAEPNLDPLVSSLCESFGLPENRIEFPQIVMQRDQRWSHRPLAWCIARFMHAYGVKARDAYRLLDMLQTALALSGSSTLQGAYLIPLVIGQLKGLPPGNLPPVIQRRWVYLLTPTHHGVDLREVPFDALAFEIENALTLTFQQLREKVSTQAASYAEHVVAENRAWNGSAQLSHIENYPKLVEAVSRFQNPKIEASPA